MPGRLRDPSGRPAPRVRLLAGLVVFGMLALTAPVVVLPLLRALYRLVF